jgi:Tfp pilus assembly protein PilX
MKRMNNDTTVVSVTKSQRGMVSVIALMVLVSVVTLIAIMTLRVADTGVNDSLNQSSNVAALFLAESGLEYATQQLSSGAETCGAMAATTQSFGRGSFTISTTATTDYDGVTALSAGQCRVQVSGKVSNTDVTRTVEGIINYNGGASSVAQDSASSISRNNDDNFTFAHTVTTTGSNLLLLVGVVIRQDASQTVNYVRYNAQDLTKMGDMNTTGLRVELWQLANPATGSNNVEVDVTGSKTGIVAGAISFTGVDQTTPVEASDFTQCGSGSPATTSVTTLTNNAWLVDILGATKSSSVSPTGSGHTSAWSAATGGMMSSRVLGASAYNGPQSPAGSYSVDWSLSSTPRNWCLGAAAIKPASSAGIGVLSWREVVS